MRNNFNCCKAQLKYKFSSWMEVKNVCVHHNSLIMCEHSGIISWDSSSNFLVCVTAAAAQQLMRPPPPQSYYIKLKLGFSLTPNFYDVPELFPAIFYAK